jgi:hypothetical protein
MSDRQNTREVEIERILALTRAARQAAEAGDWNTALAHELERRPLIRSYFAQPVSPAARTRVAAAIREMLSCDAGLIALAAKTRGEVLEETRRLRRGRKATAAYVAAGNYSARRLPPVGKALPQPDSGPVREVIDFS